MSDHATATLNAALEGRYSIEQRLGEGGMATVYLAADLKHDRKVAIKVLKPELAAVVGAERFLAEIKTTANLQHPHILPLFDSGQADGILYYVMPYVEGESLRDRLDRERQLPIEETVRLAVDLAEALDHAHRQGVVHRDIKPANILVRDGRPVIADFGIALAVGTAGSTRLTETGLSLGTPFYMSPEQAVGDQEVTAATDIYALACVVYEALAGEPPHTGSTAQAVLARILTGSVTPAGDVRSSIPANVDAALRQALERLPADRPPSAAAFAAALTDPTFRYGNEPTTTGGLSPRRTGALVLAGVAFGTVAGWLLAGRADPVPTGVDQTGADRPVQVTFSGRTGKPGISPDGGLVAFVSAEDCEYPAFQLCSYDLLVQEVGAIRPVTLLEDAADIGSIRWLHDGSTILFTAELSDGRSGLFAIPRLGGAIRAVAGLGAFDTHPRGDTLVYLPAGLSAGADPARTGTHALVLLYPSGEVVDSIPISGTAPNSLMWSPDGTRLAVRDDGLAIVARDGTELDRQSFAGARDQVRWSVTGDALYYFRIGAVREDDIARVPIAEDGSIGEPELVRGGVPSLYQGLFDIARETGSVAFMMGDARQDLWSVDLTRRPLEPTRRTSGTTWYGRPGLYDDREMFYLRGDAVGDNLYVLDLATGVEDAVSSSEGPGGWAPRFSPAGDRVAYTRVDGALNLIEVVELPSRRLRQIRPERPVGLPIPLDSDRILASVVTPDGYRMAIIEAATGAITLLDMGGTVESRSFAPSPDGERFVASMIGDPGSTTLVTLPTAGGEPRILTELEGDLPASWVSLGWSSRGILVGRWLTSDESPSLWRWDEERESLVRLVDLPVPCTPQSIATDFDASIAICQTDESRFDIFVLEGLGR